MLDHRPPAHAEPLYLGTVRLIDEPTGRAMPEAVELLPDGTIELVDAAAIREAERATREWRERAARATATATEQTP